MISMASWQRMEANSVHGRSNMEFFIYPWLLLATAELEQASSYGLTCIRVMDICIGPVDTI